MTPEEQRQKKNQELLESYNWYKAHHICVRCRSVSATDGFVTCQACREAMNENRRIRYAALTTEQKAELLAKKKSSQRSMASCWTLHTMWQRTRRPEPFNV